jgi:hypothetical protein
MARASVRLSGPRRAPPSASGGRPTPGHTAEVEHPAAKKFYALVWHFLAALDSYYRALYVHDGEELREEMGRYFRGKPRAPRVLIVNVEAEGESVATATARVGYTDGTEGRVKVVVRKGDPAWLVDWPATRALWE